MEALLWMAVVGALVIAGLLAGFLRRSVWLGGGLVLLGIALAATMLLAPHIFPSEEIQAVPRLNP